ncbi:MAG: M28 family peptidase [bacterium]
MKSQLVRSSTCKLKMLFLVLVLPLLLLAQKKFPEDMINQSETTAHIKYIASDKLMGRRANRPEINLAADYIAAEFRKARLLTFPNAKNYMQIVERSVFTPPTSGYIIILKDTLHLGTDIALRSGERAIWNASCVFAGFGVADTVKGMDDYSGLDVKGKIAVIRYGTGTGSAGASARKAKLAIEKGARALIELVDDTTPWQALLISTSQVSSRSLTDPAFVHLYVHDGKGTYLKAFQEGTIKSMSLNTEGLGKRIEQWRNVIGWIQGTNPLLRDEYLLLTAHYDHLGAGSRRGVVSGDTIFNGARDNGMGTVAIIVAAKAFAAQPPARSVIIAAVTGEEMGLIGSSYLAENFPVPLRQVVFQFNNDGAGYTDTSVVTVVGLQRTTAEPSIVLGSARYGLKAIPEIPSLQSLFNASDNVPFIRRGVPAPTYSPGFHEFDAELRKYYHQPGDQADEFFNYTYLAKFCQAYTYSARLIADMKERPFWIAGDQYEAVGKTLYGK